MAKYICCGLTKPLSLLVCEQALYRIDRFFPIGELHFNKEKEVAVRIVLSVAHIEVEVVEFYGVVGFKLEMHGVESLPPLRIYGLIAFKNAIAFARAKHEHRS